jgi:hypothetical protein
MGRRKITEDVMLLLHRHNNAEATSEKLKEWTTEKCDYYLSRLDWLESAIDGGNHEAYRIAFNQLKTALEDQKPTLDKLHDLLIFEPETKQKQSDTGEAGGGRRS